jgi:eukaryotic-like serine/threonine-protein kinase
MPLVIGASLGPYEILAPLGAGGMGEVYMARDTRLDRTVAIKVLSAQLATDQQFRDRFDREARAVAALSHPHICALYDVGHQDGTAFLVMEYLEGETLDARLKKDRLPVAQALQYAAQIGDALDKAHRAGIVHRDLKPGNIMLTRAGAKLLDFGLAKAVAPGGATAGLSMLPTTPPALTAQGTIIGTFQYMAPEQLEGKEADARTDIFAFGAVIYEMLTGRKAFEGKSQASLISSIMSFQPPPVSSVQTLTPPALDRLVARCLAKDPDERWQSVRDLLFQLSSISESGMPAVGAIGGAPRRSRERIAWAVAALALLAFAIAAALPSMRRAPAPASEIDQFVVLPPEKGVFAQSIGQPNFAISPDGRQLAFVASDVSGSSRLWIRPLSSLVARPLSDTENSFLPFWSPDGRSLGFFASGKLKRVDVGSGGTQVLADATFPLGGAWSREGFILFGADLSHPLLRVPAGGGAVAPVTSQDQPTPGSVHGAPSVLPDGRHFLFTVYRGPAIGSVFVGSVDSKEIKPVVNVLTATFSPPGYLLFAQGSSLMAQGFDLSQLSTSGDPIAIADIGGPLSPIAVSPAGTLVYRAGAAAETELVWVDRSGRRLGVAAPRGFYENIALSPDDKRVAFDRGTTSNDVWLLDLQRQIPSRFTFQPPNNNVAVWSPDGQRIAFASSRGAAIDTPQNPGASSRSAAIGTRNPGEVLDIYQRPSNASAPDELLLELKAQPIMFPSDWSRDGRFLTYYRTDSKTQLDEWVLPLFGDRKPFLFLRSEFNESMGQFSPDGKWMAYVSDESGNTQVYVQSFPEPTGKWQISAGGGVYPRWSPNGKELFYVALDGKLMSVTVRSGTTFEAEAPHVMFATSLSLVALRQTYSVSSDGQRFLLNTPADTGQAPLTVLVNWPALLRK